MLESIAINRSLNENLKQPFTAGHLAECLLYYGQVNAVVSSLELTELVRKCGIDNLILLLSSQALRLHVIFSAFGVSRTAGTNRFNYGLYSNTKDKDIRTLTYRALYKTYHNAIKCDQHTERLAPLISQYDQESSLVRGFLIQEDFTTKAFRETLKHTFPDYPVPLDLRYRLYPAEKSDAPAELAAKYTFEMETNFDTAQFERDLIKHKAATNPSIGVDFIMQAGSAIQDIDVASTFQSELSSDDDNRPIIQNAILNLDVYKPNNAEAILDFKVHELPGCPSVAEVIDSGQQSFDEFMRLFDRSQRFKEWIRNASDDSDHTIITEYQKACEAQDFTGGWAFKLLKFVVVDAPIAASPLVFTEQPALLSSAVNLVVGPLISEATSHLAARFNRWKPNQFVQKTLTPFLKTTL